MKKIKLPALVILIPVLLLGAYLYGFQQLVIEGSVLADEHCMKVNPLVISRKNAYLEQMNLILASASAEEVHQALQNYQIASDLYLAEENKWLSKQRSYLDGEMFKLMMPAYIKTAAEFQYQMYEAEYKSSLYTNQAFSIQDQTQQMEITSKVIEETNKSKVASDNYNKAWDDNKGKFDWRFRFIKVPKSDCPAENFDMPDTENLFTPKVPANTDTTHSG